MDDDEESSDFKKDTGGEDRSSDDDLLEDARCPSSSYPKPHCLIGQLRTLQAKAKNEINEMS